MSDLTPKPVRATPYLTVIANRLPRQKAHSQRGHAHAALSQRVRYTWRGESQPPYYRLLSDAALYEWRDDDWRLLWEGKAGDAIDRDAPPWKKAAE